MNGECVDTKSAVAMISIQPSSKSNHDTNHSDALTSETCATTGFSSEEESVIFHGNSSLSCDCEDTHDWTLSSVVDPCPSETCALAEASTSSSSSDPTLSVLHVSLGHVATTEEQIQSSDSSQPNPTLEDQSNQTQDVLSNNSGDRSERSIESLQLQIQELLLENNRLRDENLKLNQKQDETIQQEHVLQNRINETKKKETHKTQVITQLEDQIQQYQVQIKSLETQLIHMTQSKGKLQEDMEILKNTCVESVQAAEHAWKEERALNEERKEKIKVYIESKAHELATTQRHLEKVKVDLHQANETLTSLRKKVEDYTQLHQQDQIRIRDLIKENQKLKKNTHQLSQVSDTLEYQLIQTTQESVQHENKRKEARHELMTLLRKLQVEQVTVENYKEVLTLSLIPKAKSQQQLLQNCIHDFIQAFDLLQKKYIYISNPGTRISLDHVHCSQAVEEQEQEKDVKQEDTIPVKRKVMSRDTTTIIAHVEQETQQVSRGILEMIQLVEKMQLFLEDSSSSTHHSTCFTSITTLLHHATSSIVIPSSTTRNHPYTMSHGNSNKNSGGKRVVEHRRILPTIPNLSSYHETSLGEDDE